MNTFEKLTATNIEYQREKADAIRQSIVRLSDTYSPTTALHESKLKLIEEYRAELEKTYQVIESLT